MSFYRDPEIEEFSDEQLLYELVMRHQLKVNTPEVGVNIAVGKGEMLRVSGRLAAFRAAFGEDF